MSNIARLGDFVSDQHLVALGSIYKKNSTPATEMATYIKKHKIGEGTFLPKYLAYQMEYAFMCNGVPDAS